MKAESVTSRSFGGTMRYHCFKFVGVTNWSWFTLTSSDKFMCTGSLSVNPASFSTPALSVAESITFCRLPRPPSTEKCSCTVPIILWKENPMVKLRQTLNGFWANCTWTRLFRIPCQEVGRLRPIQASVTDQDWDSVLNLNDREDVRELKLKCSFLYGYGLSLIFSSHRP